LYCSSRDGIEGYSDKVAKSELIGEVSAPVSFGVGLNSVERWEENPWILEYDAQIICGCKG
jgi:hypothetical protein